MEPRSMISIADTLRTTRERLSSMAKQYFSDYANQTMLWKDKEGKSLRPVRPYDSSAIAFTKHCLLALQETEALVHSMDKLMHEYQTQASGIPMFTAKKAAASVADRLVNQDRPAAEEEPWALDLVLAVKNHLAAMVEIAKSSGLMNTAEVKKIAESLAGISTAELDAKHAKEYLVTHFSNVSQAVSDLMTTYLDSTRPMIPSEPEKKYETTKPIRFELLAEVPKKWDVFEPDTYLIIKDGLGKWQVIYLDSHKNNYPIEHIDINLAQLKKILEQKSLAELKTNKDDQQAIKQALAKHWNPSVQERTEWFGVLLEPIRSAMQGTQKLSELFNHFANDAQQKGIPLDPEQTNMIKRTQAVLERSAIDKDGYYLFLDDKEETAMSKSLKGIYNILWGINEIARGFWEHPGAKAYYHAKKHVIKALSSYWKISWTKMGGDIGKYFDQLINAMLIYGKETTFPLLAKIAVQIDEAAIEHNLRSGATLQEVRPLLYALESTYIERGFTADNPLGYSQVAHEALQKKLINAKQKEPEIRKKLALTKMVLPQLDWFQSYFQTIAQPGTLMRTLANAFGKAPIVDTAERRVPVLLRQLTELKSQMKLTAETLSLIDKMENKLVVLLPPEKSIPRSSTAAQIKPEEMKQLQQILEQINRDLTKKFHDAAKYTEALTEQEKLRTEYAMHTLTSEGITGLISAALAATDNPKMNIRQKRKLAAILADFDRQDRAKYLANAHEIATAFAKNPAQIEGLVEKINLLSPKLGHQLAVETLVIHNVDCPDTILLSDDQTIAQQDLANLLDRFEARQVIKMLDAIAKEDKAAIVRAGFFSSLLLGGQALTEVHVNEGVEKIFKNKLSKKDLVELLVESYNVQPDNLKNKLGRFIGRLARANTELANIVFDNKKALAILQKECLTNTDSALYYESLVNTFQFAYINGKHDLERRSTTEFVNVHRATIIKMHQVMHPADNDKSEAEIMENYHSAKNLVELTDQFIRTKLSKHSMAENTMREFISALMLTNSDEMMKMRKEIIDIQLQAKGSIQAQYLQLLTTAASTRFWNNVKADLVTTPKKQLLLRLNAQANRALDLTAKLDTGEKDRLVSEIKKVMAVQKSKIKIAAAKIASAKTDIALKCKYAQQEMNAAEREVEQKMHEWSNRVNVLEKEKVLSRSASLVELKVNSISRASSSVDDRAKLLSQISKIEDILQKYLDSRIGALAKIADVMGYHLRTKKINLVTANLNEIKKISSALQSQPNADLDSEAKKIMQIINGLDQGHKTLLAQEAGPAAKKVNQASKKAGQLQKTLTQIHKLLSSSKEVVPVKDYLTQTKGTIDRFFAKSLKKPAREKTSTALLKRSKSKR